MTAHRNFPGGQAIDVPGELRATVSRWAVQRASVRYAILRWAIEGST